MADLVAGDTNSTLRVTCFQADKVTPLDLTGATVQLKYRIGGGGLQTKTMTITSATVGKAEYKFLAGELTTGTMEFEVAVTSGGLVVTSQSTATLTIRAAL